MNVRSIVKHLVPRKLYAHIEPYGHRLEGAIAQAQFHHPAKGLRVIGVTGSAGKTTTTTIIASVLREAGYKVAYFTTAENDFGDGKRVMNMSRMTTLQVRPLLRQIVKARRENDIDFLVLEVTAHALHQGRVLGIPFEMAVFTNLDHEHLDYFGTMKNYSFAKQRLFRMLRRTGGTGIINIDNEHASEFMGLAPKDVTYGLSEQAMVRASNVQASVTGNTFTVIRGDQSFSVTGNIPGEFNVSNCLAAAATGLELGIAPEVISKGIAALDTVPGRMERYNTSAGFTALIDFAHTPDSFEKLYKELRPITTGRLISVFGCPGERDHAKRAMEGNIAAQYSEVVIVTEEDPRSEDNDQIMREIVQGIEESGQKREVHVVPVREQAIEQAVAMAKPGDVIVLLSKGPEPTIEYADGPRPWDEFGALKAALDQHKTTIVSK